MAGLQSFRQQHPEYNDMPDNQLSDALYKKFYSDMPREQFDAKIGIGQDAPPAPAVSQPIPQPESEKLPRWDILGDIDRSAASSVKAIGDDFGNAFPSGETLKASFKANRDKGGIVGGSILNQLDSGSRLLSLAKVPLDAMGAVASPLTGALHAIGGSALSYLPQLSEDMSGKPADSKEIADSIIDQAMMGIGPRGGMKSAASEFAARRANTVARTDAKLKNRAIDRVNTRLSQDGVTPQEIVDAQRRANAAGEQLTLMDVGGKNVKGLAGAVYRAPGPAGREIDQFLEARDGQATAALSGDVQANVANGSTYHTTQDLLKARSEAARPAYEAVESVGPIHSERLQTFINQPEVQEGLRRGLKLERQNAIAEDRPFVDSDYAVTGYKDGNLDMPIFGKVPTVKSMIVAIEGLGAKISEMVHPVTGRITKDGLALKKFRDALQGEVNRLTGGKLKAAQDQWSGPSQSMEALREGRDHFARSESNEQLADEFSKLSDGDKDFYRMGAAEAKVDAVERAPDASDKSKRVINSERDRKRFRILFDSDAQAEKFIADVARKRAMFETRQAIKGGSQTAGRLADDVSESIPTAIEAAKTGAHIASGNWLGAAQSLYNMKRDLGLRNNPKFNSEIARILMDPNLPNSAGTAALLPRVPLPKRSGNLIGPVITPSLFGQAFPRHNGSGK